MFGPNKGKGGDLGGKTDEQLVRDLIHIHNAENWLGMDGDSELSMFNPRKGDLDDSLVASLVPKGMYTFSLSKQLMKHKRQTIFNLQITYSNLFRVKKF